MIHSIPIQNHLVMPQSNSKIPKPRCIDCSSWRLAVETHNLQNWKLVPAECKDYVANYMLSPQYHNDCDLVTEEAYKYAQGLTLGGDGMDIWVFDIDETAISNVPYYESLNFELSSLMNETSFYEWLTSTETKPIPASLKLYERLVNLGFKIVFLTGTSTSMTETRAKQLKEIGYTAWEKLILRGESGEDVGIYKSRKRKELEEQKYKIRGNIGDQWSDLLGINTGDRTFKLPNPLYYVP